MNLFDILGPVMVGPSSSHTAGAVRIGLIARRLLGEGTPSKAKITLFGSFAATGKGHGTDRALIAGLLGMNPDDERIGVSFDWAKGAGMEFSFIRSKLAENHPNTAKVDLVSKSGKTFSVVASSLGGGRIVVTEMNGVKVQFSGELSTMIIQNVDKPGRVGEVSTVLADYQVNIAAMQLYRNYRGGNAVMIIETDRDVPSEAIDALSAVQGIMSVIAINKER